MKILKILLASTVIWLFMIQVPAMAQASNTPDYIVLQTGDTLYGQVKHIRETGVRPKYYKKIRLTNTRGKQKKYKRKEVVAFRVNKVHYQGFWLSQSSRGIQFVNPRYDIDPQKGKKYFLRVISKGKLSHYHLEWWEQGESAMSWMDLLKKEDDSFLIRANQGLLGLKRKVLAKYFLNCPRLEEQIKKRQLKKVREVVNFYNSHCAH